MSKATKFILAVFLQLTIVLLIILFKIVILAGGTEILLKIEPVDPRDPLRGDYITFQYQISHIDTHLLDDQVKNNDTVYVLLKDTGKYWVASRIKKSKPVSKEVFLRGKIASGGLSREKELFPSRSSGVSRITVVYGIEEYYIPENKGARLNLGRGENEIYAKVAVDDDGKAVLKQVYVDNKPWP